MVSVHIDAGGEVARCRVAGELDSYGVAALREGMAALSAFRSAVLELDGVSFIDSAGLSVLVGTIRRMRQSGSQLVLAGARPSIARVLDVAGLSRIVAIAPTTDEAIAMLATPAAS